jgi:hypothetical protein
MRRSSIANVVVATLALALPVTLALAETKPTKTVTGHPNLAAAQKLTAQAFEKLEAAQKANEYDLGGHAAKAKGLLKQANDEIKLAAEAADKNAGEKGKR